MISKENQQVIIANAKSILASVEHLKDEQLGYPTTTYIDNIKSLTKTILEFAQD